MSVIPLISAHLVRGGWDSGVGTAGPLRRLVTAGGQRRTVIVGGSCDEGPNQGAFAPLLFSVRQKNNARAVRLFMQHAQAAASWTCRRRGVPCSLHLLTRLAALLGAMKQATVLRKVNRVYRLPWGGWIHA